jgi:Holliday junction resolvasome RuvABC DNA-binding subunit
MIKETQIDKLESKLAEMAGNSPEAKRPTTRKALFVKYKTEIMSLIEMGHPVESIKDVMDSVGVEMTVSTIQQYIREMNRSGGKERSTGGNPA